MEYIKHMYMNINAELLDQAEGNPVLLTHFAEETYRTMTSKTQAQNCTKPTMSP